MPIPLNLNDKSKLDWKHLEENPDLMQKHSEWNDSRAEHIRKMHTGETKERQDYYKKGIDTKGCPYLGLHKLFYRYSKPKDSKLTNS